MLSPLGKRREEEACDVVDASSILEIPEPAPFSAELKCATDDSEADVVGALSGGNGLAIAPVHCGRGRSEGSVNQA